MAKAVALVQGWPYERHGQFYQVMNQARRLTSNDRIRLLTGRADALHANSYDLRSGLDDEVIREDLEDMAELLNLLEPLA